MAAAADGEEIEKTEATKPRGEAKGKGRARARRSRICLPSHLGPLDHPSVFASSRTRPAPPETGNLLLRASRVALTRKGTPERRKTRCHERDRQRQSDREREGEGSRRY